MKNIGTGDRVIRIVIGLGVLSLFFVLNQERRYFGLLGLIPLVTGLTGYCPMYAALHVKTNKPRI